MVFDAHSQVIEIALVLTVKEGARNPRLSAQPDFDPDSRSQCNRNYNRMYLSKNKIKTACVVRNF